MVCCWWVVSRDDVAATQLVAAMVPRWRDQPGVHHLPLDRLPPSSVVDMIADMLRVDTATAAALAGILAPHTSGNPYEVVELLNGLRGQGALTLTAAGWCWDEPALRAQLSRSDIAELLAARVRAMPAPTRRWCRRWPASAGESSWMCCGQLSPSRLGWWKSGWRRRLMRVSWSSSRECTRRCGSAMTASARRFCVA